MNIRIQGAIEPLLRGFIRLKKWDVLLKINFKLFKFKFVGFIWGIKILLIKVLRLC